MGCREDRRRDVPAERLYDGAANGDGMGNGRSPAKSRWGKKLQGIQKNCDRAPIALHDSL
ncbi:MAG: hypothetical protein VKJ24_13875 [Synechococcales bacterium]|nr:hypothetical protein [Synechococcales bacterium]